MLRTGWPVWHECITSDLLGLLSQSLDCTILCAEGSTWRLYFTTRTAYWWHLRTRFPLWRWMTPTAALLCRTFFGSQRFVCWSSHHLAFFCSKFQLFWVVCVQLSCMWEDVRWLRQSMSVSMSSSSTLQARHKMLSAASQMQVSILKVQIESSRSGCRLDESQLSQYFPTLVLREHSPGIFSGSNTLALIATIIRLLHSLMKS